MGFQFPPPPRNRRKPTVSRSVKSVSGYTLISRPKGTNRVVVSVLDRNGRLIHKMNFHEDDWKEFTA